MHADPQTPRLYGLMAEFDNPDALVAASRRARREGYRELDAYTPFPIEELHEALDIHHTKVPLMVLIGGIVGGLAGYGLQVPGCRSWRTR